MRSRRWLQASLSLAILLVAQRAAAQSMAPHAEWNPYSTSAYSEGEGIPIGQRQSLHVGGTLETGYDTNVFYLPSKPIGANLLRVRGRINLATRPPADAQQETRAADPIAAYALPLEAEYREYISSDSAVQAQRSLNLMTTPVLMLWPAGPLTVFAGDTFVRTSDPRNAETFKKFARDFDRVSLLGRAALGGGRLELGLGGYYQTTLWEASDMEFANNIGAEGQAFGRWHFTHELDASLIVRGGYTHYGNQSVLDSRPLRTMLSVSNKFSRWLRASAGAGYGSSFAFTGPSYGGPLATAAVQVTVPWEGTLEARYERDFFDSLFANYYVDDHFALVYAQPFEHEFVARVAGGVRLRHYRGLLDPAVIQVVGYSSPERDDRIFDANVEVAYRAKPWFNLALTYNMQADATPFEFITANGPVEATYVKHSVFLRGEFGN